MSTSCIGKTHGVRERDKPLHPPPPSGDRHRLGVTLTGLTFPGSSAIFQTSQSSPCELRKKLGKRLQIPVDLIELESDAFNLG